jgi:hypothetical protein
MPVQAITGRIASSEIGRAKLAALVGRDARLHLIGLRRELWCEHCGEPPFYGWVAAAVASR